MTDTAELVRVLREQAKKNSAKIFLPVDVYPEWQAAAALEATQARADKLEAELVEAKRERDDALSERDACHTVMRDFRETIQPVIPNARLMFFFSIAEEILAQHQSNENWMNRCLAAESRAAAMREALESVNKLIEWERENGTHFALVGEEESRLVFGLWTDAKNAVSRALQEG